MKKKELRKRLRKLGFRWDDYNLNGVFFYVYTGYVLKHKNGRWEVYYIERTIRNLVGIFEKEEDACDFFISLIYKFLEIQNIEILLFKLSL